MPSWAFTGPPQEHVSYKVLKTFILIPVYIGFYLSKILKHYLESNLYGHKNISMVPHIPNTILYSLKPYPIPAFAGLLLDLLPPAVEEQERPRGEHLGRGAGGGQGLCWEPSKDRCAGPVIPQVLVAGSWCAAIGMLTSWSYRDIHYLIHYNREIEIGEHI